MAPPDPDHQPLTRQQLYYLAWSEPMLRIAERFNVSSSYLARVFTELRIPRPAPGYWAKREYGNSPPQPALPPIRPGDLETWAPGNAIGNAVRATVKPVRRSAEVATSSEASPVELGDARVGRRKRSKPPTDSPKRHELLTNVRPLFLNTRVRSYEYGLLGGGHLRPYKRLLVDILTSEKTLDVALSAAQTLFGALEQRGHRVAFSAPGHGSRRPELDVLEVPVKQPHYQQTWAKDRITVLYVGGVEIGLTLFEMIEKVETIRVGDKKLAVRDLSPNQLRLYSGDRFWRSTSEYASGRLCFFAYCLTHLATWSRRWPETNAGQFEAMVPGIVHELEDAAPLLARQIEEGRRRQEQLLLEWEESRRKEREEAERQRQIKTQQEARRDLLAAIAAWDEARRIGAYFATVAERIDGLPLDEANRLRERLRLARELIGDADPLASLAAWTSPGER